VLRLSLRRSALPLLRMHLPELGEDPLRTGVKDRVVRHSCRGDHHMSQGCGASERQFDYPRLDGHAR
jgi:hypothetical protein